MVLTGCSKGWRVEVLNQCVVQADVSMTFEGGTKWQVTTKAAPGQSHVATIGKDLYPGEFYVEVSFGELVYRSTGEVAELEHVGDKDLLYTIPDEWCPS